MRGGNMYLVTCGGVWRIAGASLAAAHDPTSGTSSGVTEFTSPTNRLKELCHKKKLVEAIELARILARVGQPLPIDDLYCLLQCCINKRDVTRGREVHSLIKTFRLESNAFLGSHLIRLFDIGGSLCEASQVFKGIFKPNVYAWTAIISAHAKFGEGEEAMELYRKMQASGYAEHGHGEQAFRLFKQMQQEGTEPNNVSFLSVLKACCLINSVMEGMRAHASIMQIGCVLDASLSNALIDMYAKCGSLELARHLFEKYSSQDVVAWNTIITGYAQVGCIKGHAQCGQCKEALQLFNIMRQEGLTPDIVTWNTFLAGLSHHGQSHEALWLFQQMLSTNIEPSVATFGLELDLMVSGTLVDMYAKCGSWENAISVFNKEQVHNVVTWSTLIAGLVHNHHHNMALNFFKLMLREGCKPNEVTFVSVFSACSHAGLLDECYSYFKLMQESYGIRATLEHYNCLVDILGAAGYILEAKQVLLSIPFQRNIIGWTSLLSSCRQHKDIPIARQCFERALAMDNMHAAFYVMMANIYNDAGMTEEREQVLSLKRLIETQKY